jgi:integrase
MTPAGSPATLEPQHPHSEPIRPDGANCDAPAPTAGGELFAAFRAEATKRREEHSRQDAGRPADWADPDPMALTLLLPRRNPIARVLARQKEGTSRYNVESKLKVACARLLGATERSVPMDAVHSYPWHHIDADSAEDFRRDIYRAYSLQTSRNEYVSVVRRVITECHRVGLISALRRDSVLEQLYTMAPGPSTRRRRLTSLEIHDLFSACEAQADPRATARDTAIVALLRTSGMRSIELAHLTVGDWDTRDNSLLLRQTKNRLDHRVMLHPDVLPYLHRWVAVRGTAPGALFTPLAGTDARHLHPKYVHQRIQLHARSAGIAPFGSHDFRRTFATELLRHNDPALVGKLLNHKKLTSTMVYDLASEDEQREAVASIDLPNAPETDGSDDRAEGTA